MNPYVLLLIGSVVALGALYVLLPVTLDVYRRYKRLNLLRCPESGQMTSVELDAARAAKTSIFGHPRTRVRECARWPEREDCGQKCLEEIA